MKEAESRLDLALKKFDDMGGALERKLTAMGTDKQKAGVATQTDHVCRESQYCV